MRENREVNSEARLEDVLYFGYPIKINFCERMFANFFKDSQGFSQFFLEPQGFYKGLFKILADLQGLCKDFARNFPVISAKNFIRS